MTSPSRRRADLALAGNTVIWGSTFVVVKEALNNASPLLFLALRFALAGVALALVFRARWGRRGDAAASLRAGVVAGVCLFAGYAFQTFGLKYTSAPKSAFITGMSVVLVPFLAGLVYGKRPGVSELLGSAVAATGMGLMTLKGPVLSLERGDLLTLFCALAFAAHIVALGHYAPRVSFELVSVVQVAVAALLAGGSFWWAEAHFIRWTPAVVSALVITGLLATALAFSVQAWAQRYTTPTHTALIFALEPVFAWLASFLLAGEGLSARAAAGAALILAGILIVELKPIRAA
jgi:drug/metabolite transporter (DMT)-like permease